MQLHTNFSKNSKHLGAYSQNSQDSRNIHNRKTHVERKPSGSYNMSLVSSAYIPMDKSMGFTPLFGNNAVVPGPKAKSRITKKLKAKGEY